MSLKPLYSVAVVTCWVLLPLTLFVGCSVTGGELFEDIVAREYYSEADAR